MKNLNDPEVELEHRQLHAVLTPSWLSGLLAVTAGLVMTVGVIISFHLQGQVQQQLMSWEHTSKQPALTLPGQGPTNNATSSLQNTWPLIAFWGVIGLVAYFAMETFMKAGGRLNEIREEMDYVNMRRDVLIKDVAIQVIVRFGVAIIWLLFLNLFFKRIIPYSITLVQGATNDLLTVNAVLRIIWAFCLITGSLHLQTIFLRFTLGRARVFSSTDYR